MGYALIFIGLLAGVVGIALLVSFVSQERLPGDPWLGLFLSVTYLEIFVVIARCLRQAWRGDVEIRWGWAMLTLGVLAFAGGVSLLC